MDAVSTLKLRAIRIDDVVERLDESAIEICSELLRRHVPEHSLNKIRWRNAALKQISVYQIISHILVQANGRLKPLISFLVFGRAVIAVLLGEVHDPCTVAQKKANAIGEALIVLRHAIVVLKPSAGQHVAITPSIVSRDEDCLLPHVNLPELLAKPVCHLRLELREAIRGSARILALEDAVLIG